MESRVTDVVVLVLQTAVDRGAELGADAVAKRDGDVIQAAPMEIERW